MKKMMLVGMTLAAASFAGCSSDEVAENSMEQAISFENAFVENMTRTGEFTNDNVPNLAVYGAFKAPNGAFLYAFDGKEVDGSGTYQPIQYWLEDAQYWFTAFAPYGSANWSFQKNTVAPTTGTFERGVGTFNNETAAGEEDFLMACVDPISYSKDNVLQQVPLNFKHMLTRVKFEFSTELSPAYKFQVSEVKLVNAYGEASFSLPVADKPFWSVPDNVADQKLFTLDFPVQGGDGSFYVGDDAIVKAQTDSKYLIPVKGTKSALIAEFTISMIQEGSNIATFKHAVSLADVPWLESGKSVKLNVILNKQNLDPTGDNQFGDLIIKVTNEDWVSEESAVSFPAVPATVKWIDFGLPSGTLWASHNVGASKPEEYGDYFAWGQTITTADYVHENTLTYGKYMENIAGNPKYDAAFANWGASVQMPTVEDFQELVDHSNVIWTTLNGVNGCLFVDKKDSGNEIFFPAGGVYHEGALHSEGDHVYSWTATPDNGTAQAYSFFCGIGSLHLDYLYQRGSGRNVRPVCK